MSVQKNKFDLSRSIPEPVKREVRQRSGFGCVICGLIFYDYEHFDPPYAEATQHDPNGICLLCPNHHRRAGRPTLSKEEVGRAYADPFALRRGYASDSEFVKLRRPLTVRLGQMVFVNPNAMISFQGEEILGLAEDSDGYVSFNGRFFDTEARLILEVVSNEWRGPVQNWDIEQSLNRLTIRHAPGKIALAVEAVSPNDLVFSHVEMNIKGARLVSLPGQNAQIRGAGPGGAIVDLPQLSFGGHINLNANGDVEIRGGARLG